MDGTILKDETKGNVLIWLFYFPLAHHKTHISQTPPITRAPHPHEGTKNIQKSLQLFFLSNCFWPVEIQNMGAKMFSFGFLQENSCADAKPFVDPAWIVLKSGSVLALKYNFQQRVVEKWQQFYQFWPQVAMCTRSIPWQAKYAH